MKQRITFFRRHGDEFDPASLQVDSNSLRVNYLRAAKEHRLTIGPSELPVELTQALEQLHEFHLRWISPKPFKTPAPLASRASPGLHVFATPNDNSTADLLCPTLQSLFLPGSKCLGLEKSFSTPRILSTRFTSAASFQYHANVPSLAHVALHLQQKICRRTDPFCHEAAFSLLTASYLDVDYDTISRALVFTAFWDQADGEQGWNEHIKAGKAESRVEVGVLNDEKASEAEELSLGGFLIVVGEDSQPSSTLFSFPSRYHPLPDNGGGRFRVSFKQPTGLHPTMELEIQDASQLKAPWADKSCSLHTYLTLPCFLFIDQYQFSDSLFLDAHNLVSLRTISGATDLEAPDYAVNTWGSAALFELKTPADNDGHKKDHKISIPMHLRYLAPAPGGYTNISIPWPVVFWACRAEEGTKMPVNPFDRRQLGYDVLFGERTAFWHLQLDVSPSTPGGTADLSETITVPVLDTQKSGFIQGATSGAVALGFLWILWVLFTPGSSGKEAGKKNPQASRGKANTKPKAN